jgi:hypothetical protein
MGSSLVLNRRPKVPAEDTAAFGAIAERFRRAGALEQAVSLCREGLNKFPDHVSARVTLGWSLLDLGKYDEARSELEQVLRRAPDNLAAIRGLAELHDRFEHTLNLPMDGPGQWPPPADSVELEPEVGASAPIEAGDEGAAEESDSVSSFAETEFATPAMTPPEMGLPLWTPEPAASAMAEPAPSNSVMATGTGMSSVREIDAFAGAPIPVQAAVTEPVQESAPIDMSVGELGVIDETLAALIAEADSLDAAADLQVQTPSALEGADAPEFGEAIELGADDLQSVELAAVEMEAAPLAATSDAVEFEEVSTPVVMDAVREDIVEVVTAPIATEIDKPEVAPAVVHAEAAEPEVELAPAAMDVVQVEASSVQVNVQVVEEEREQPAEVIAFASRPLPAPLVAESQAMELLPDEEASVQPVTSPRKGAATVVALERMLARVHARRLQLMAESVA